VPVQRVVRWLVALGMTGAGFAVVLWIADAWGGLDRATSLGLASAAAPLLAGPFAWWASQPIEAGSWSKRGVRASASGADEAGTPGAVFVCYSQTDGREYAERLAAFLNGSGVPVWLDREIVSGQRWTQAIEKQLDLCSAVVVVMTPAASRSEWVDREIVHALAGGKPILPLLRAGRPFFSLANVQYEDVTDGSLPGPGFVSRLHSVAGVQLPRPAARPVEMPLAPAPAPPTRSRGKPWRRILVAAALVLVVLAAGTTAIVLSATGRKGDGTGGSEASPDYPYAPPGIVVSPDGQWLYVTLNLRQMDSEGSEWRGALVAVDAQTRVTSVPFWFALGAGHGVITPDGKQMYIALDHNGVANVFQLGANPMGISGFDLPGQPSATAASPAGAAEHPRMAISPDGRRLYVADPGASVVWPADLQKRSLGTAIKLDDIPQDIVISPDGKHLYVVAGLIRGYGKVVSIETGTGTVLNHFIVVGADPRGIAISRDGTRLYVANHGSDTVSAIDTRTGSVIRQFRPGCGTKPVSVAVGRDASRVYVICETSNVVAAMDGATGTTIGTPVQVGRRPASMALSPDGARLYVTTVEPTTIDVAAIDTATNALAVKPFPAATWYHS
jgi:YVTN family beta-propeller protein